jgi:alpha-beta hydrolase superfamily lysophospholipase
MVHREFHASDGVGIRFRQWNPGGPRGVIVAVHGIQSHSGWYKATCRQLGAAGWEVCFADRRGSGWNGDRRGHAAHGMRLINDVRSLQQLIRHERTQAGSPEGPAVLLGLSWGGRIATAAAALFADEWDGLALLYPGLVPRIRPRWWQTLALKFARRWELTRTDIPIPLRDVSLFTASPAGQRFIQNDPLALHTVTSGLLNSGRDLDAIIRERMHTIQIPVLLMLAGRDRIIDNDRTRELVRSCRSVQRTEIVYPDASHTLEFEPNHADFCSDLLHWLDAVKPDSRRAQVPEIQAPVGSDTSADASSVGVLRLPVAEPGGGSHQPVPQRDRSAQ